MDETSSTNYFTPISRRTVIGIILTGLVTAVIIFLLGNLLNSYIINPSLCRGETTSACLSSELTSFHIASAISAVVGVILLINASVYRPLLVAIAVAIATWNIYPAILSFEWYYSLLSLILLQSLAYLVFAWFLRIYPFVIALIPTVLLVLLLLIITR